MSDATIDNDFIASKEELNDPEMLLFREDTIAFYSNSVKLLRKEHAYKTFSYNDIATLKITRGYSIKNKLFSSIIALTLIFAASYVLYINSDMLLSIRNKTVSQWLDSSFILYLVGPLVAIFVAISSIVLAFTDKPVLHIYLENNNKEIKLKEITKNKQLAEFIQFMQSKTPLVLEI